MSKPPLVDLDNAREKEQLRVMKRILYAGECPFCPEFLGKYHQEEILKEGKYWLLTTNRWPYEHTKVHLLLIYRDHCTHISSVNPKAGEELLEFLQWATAQFEIPGGGFVLRFGDTNYSAGSVHHLHAQLVQPDIHHEAYQPVRIKLGK